MTTILVADDSAFQRKNIHRMLSANDYTILEAGTGQEVLQQVEQHHLDCILLDLVMPEGDGFAVLQALHERGSTIPVIVITADIQESTRQQCLGLGAKAVINKPQTATQLHEALAEVLRSGPESSS